MGIPRQLASVILREHRHRPIQGSILSIARQTLYMNAEGALDLVHRELGFRPKVHPEGLDRDLLTRGAREKELITDRAFYSLFSEARYHCLDVSAYEGADIVANLCSPLPRELQGRFDFIINGSCLDNIFDPAMALRNMSRLLKPGGRILHFERASRRHHVYVAFALSWFHDYYAINDFADCQAYLVQWDSNLLESRWDIYRYAPVIEQDGRLTYFGQEGYYYPHRDAHALVIAEKGEHSTWDRSPVQFEYRPNVGPIDPDGELPPQMLPKDAGDPYFASSVRFFRTARSCIVDPSEKVVLPDQHFHYAPRVQYCGSLQPGP